MKIKIKWILGLILLLAIVLRTVELDKFPYGFHYDEAKLAWNALSIMKTGMDDHGNKLPLYYNSFGDFRPTGIIYGVIPLLLILGRTILAVRLLPALIGALTIIPLYFLTKELAEKKISKTVGLWAGFFLAVNPWHISVSRASSEVIMAMFLGLWGLFFLIKTIKENKWYWATAALGITVLSFFFYHSIRILAPIFFVVTLVYFGKEIVQKKIFLPIVSVVLLVSVAIILFLSPESRGRLSQVSVKNDFAITYETLKMPNEEGPNSVLVARAFHNKYAVMGRRIAEEYASYWGTDFLVGRTAKPDRYTTTNFGLITYAELAIFLIGVVLIFAKDNLKIAWMWLMLAPLPAIVTIEDVPNLHRSMMMVPFMTMIMAWGWVYLIEQKKKLIVAGISLVWLTHFVYYLHFYFNHGNYAKSVYSRNGGMVELAGVIEKEFSNYDQIIVTNYSDNPYAWYAFFTNKNPADFNRNYLKQENGSYKYKNLIFTNERCPTTLLNDDSHKSEYKNVLFVNGEGCDVSDKLIKKTGLEYKETVYRLDESPPFKLWKKD